MQPLVFLSFASIPSAENAEDLKSRLEDRGFQVFIFTSEVPDGARFPREIVEGLLRSSLFVAFLSPEYFQSHYCLVELDLALRAVSGSDCAEPGHYSLDHFAVIPPSEGTNLADLLTHLPPSLRFRSYPSDPERIVELLVSSVGSCTRTYADLLSPNGAFDDLVEKESRDWEPDAALKVPQDAVAYGNIRPSVRSVFVGREQELWSLRYRLITATVGGGAAEPVVAVQALGGLGKSQLAAEFVHRYGWDKFDGGVIWIDAPASPADVRLALHSLLRELNPEVPPFEQYLGAGGDLRHDLQHELRTDAKRYLCVLDNLPEPQLGSPPLSIEEWFPLVGAVALLVTSRHRLTWPSLPGHGIDLRGLPTTAAVALLTRGVEAPSLPYGEWERVVAWVGHHPLALSILNASLQVGVLSPSEVGALCVAEPAGELDSQYSAMAPHLPRGALEGIVTTFYRSIEGLSTTAKDLFVAMSHFSEAPIPRALLQACCSGAEWRTLVAELVSRSLLTSASKEAKGHEVVGSLHPLLASYGRLIDDGRGRTTAADALVSLVEPEATRRGSNHTLLRLVVGHARALVLRPMPPGATAAEARAVSNVAIAAGFVLMELGLFRDAVAVDRRRRDLALEWFGTNSREAVKATHALAHSLRNIGELREAFGLQSGVVAWFRKSRLLTRDALSALGNLGDLHWRLGEFAEAESLEREVVALAVRLDGPDAPSTLIALNNLAQTLDSRGNVQDAAVLQEEVLRKRRTVLGASHPETLQAEMNLGGMVSKLGRHDDAEEHLRSALKGFRNVYHGDVHPQTATAQAELADALQRGGRNADALEVRKGLREDMIETHGRTSVEALKAADVEGELLLSLGKSEKALERYQANLTVCLDNHGVDDWRTLTSAQNLALALGTAGSLPRAIGLMRLVHAKRSITVAHDPKESGLAEFHLGSLLLQDELTPEGMGLLEEGAGLRKQALGAEHPSTLRAEAARDRFRSMLERVSAGDEARRIQEETHDDRGGRL